MKRLFIAAALAAALLPSAAIADTDGPFGISGTKTCPRNETAVLHAVSRGKVFLEIDSNRVKYVNNASLTQNDISGDHNLGSWDWNVSPWWLTERSPQDYYVSSVWATCAMDTKK